MRKFAAGFVIVFMTIFAGYYFFRDKGTVERIQKIEMFEAQEPEKFTARFEIYTNGTKRIFTNAMYHNLDENAFIKANTPNTVNVMGNVTWQQFFDTLPFSIDKNCLTTGTGQTFCSNSSQKLYFYLNDKENPNALDSKINEADFLEIRYE